MAAGFNRTWRGSPAVRAVISYQALTRRLVMSQIDFIAILSAYNVKDVKIVLRSPRWNDDSSIMTFLKLEGWPFEKL